MKDTHLIDLTGQTALITGGTRGIGRSACLQLARAGADIVFTYRAATQAARQTQAEIERLGRNVLAEQADAASKSDMERVFERAVSRFGGVNVAVANAGIWKRAPIDEMTEQQWGETIDTNLKSAYLLCHLAARHMKPRRSGTIILVSSTAGQRGEPYYSHYAASKGGIIAFTKALAAELGPSGIRVNCVAPGWVLTDMTAGVFANHAFRRSVEAGTPLGRIAEPDQIAAVILFLASDLASNVQGEVINANGGSVLCG
ncbi:MAG: SDR family NAD(P)-dependent oxidoreductase [Acidobacteriota bacterium]